ncbi:cyclic nucleotide-binding domain-containing protein [Nocardioides islandensis]|uniref:histidine kinase n=1 Tax=Nocardioides islandensis TaxID=433663 RepID=A0A930VFA5_9ACTN|nr:cyclic nucleotide-binding domain-containing protein [Nocardioides islandensis]MBF4764566.1 cyclic nucleotide-binding domain-containing protein [Nocardioides islandensis]
MKFERFRQVALFAELSDDDLSRICNEASDVSLEPGEVLFREGDPGDRAFVISSGELEIIKTTERREVLIALRTADDVIGEMALLDKGPRGATARARTATELVSIPQAALEDLLDTSPSAARSILVPLSRRIRETNDRLRHQERMLVLGVMTAGVAHELNNPAAAAQRAADQLIVDIADLATMAARGTGTEAVDLFAELAERERPERTALETSDLEAAVEEWLENHGVEDGWQLAPTLVEAGVAEPDLARLLPGPDLATAVRFLVRTAAVRQSAAQVAEASRRVSDVVQAMRSHSYLDRAPVQEVDVVRGLEDTLVLLGQATGGIRLVREYDANLPLITALGGELNQVWTNLVHNACDAVAEVEDPVVTLRAHRAGESVVVEVEDNGPGIPDELKERVFDAFFTTKPPGQGTGLGLQVSYRIVVVEHGGDLALDSVSGRTTLRVTLPVSSPTLGRPDESRKP